MLIDLIDGRLTVETAGTLTGLGRRQVLRLHCAFEGLWLAANGKRGAFRTIAAGIFRLA
jgi:hypothetical protein